MKNKNQNNPASDELIISSDMVHLPRVEAFITHLCNKGGLNEDQSDNMAIAVTEMVNNAILHGNKEDPRKNVTILANYKPDRVIVIIRDEGSGFDAGNLDDPLDPENIRKQNGRGVFLVRHLIHSVEFLPSASGTSVVLTEYIRTG